MRSRRGATQGKGRTKSKGDGNRKDRRQQERAKVKRERKEFLFGLDRVLGFFLIPSFFLLLWFEFPSFSSCLWSIFLRFIDFWLLRSFGFILIPWFFSSVTAFDLLSFWPFDLGYLVSSKSDISLFLTVTQQCVSSYYKINLNFNQISKYQITLLSKRKKRKHYNE